MNLVGPLTDADAIRLAWDRVFVSNNPFSYPFDPAVEATLVFYPTFGYWLDPTQYAAVVAAARVVGDEAFLLSIVESSGDWVVRGVESGGHWRCSFPPHQEYRSIMGPPLENAMYSPSGKWGVLISHEDHALVGGSAGFVTAVKAAYPRWQEDLTGLASFWAKHSNGAWVADVKSRITTG